MTRSFRNISLAVFFLLVAAPLRGQTVDGSRLIRVSRPKPLKDVSALDPAAIQYVDEYDLLAHLLSPLVDQDQKGEFVPGVAESIAWVGDALHLKIRTGAATVSGYPITVEDAVFSLKRMLILARDTHAKILGDLLCPDQRLRSLADDCVGIRSDKSTLILKPAYGKQSLVQILPVADLAIVPRVAVDTATLTVKSLKETSGPYYLADINPDGSFLIKANPRHWRYKANMPQSALYVPRREKRGTVPPPFDQFAEGLIDFIPDSAARERGYFVDYVERAHDATLTWTANDSCVLLVFTAKGMRDIPEERRLALGAAIRSAYLKAFASDRYRRVPIVQWFAERGGGALLPSQLSELEAIYARNSRVDGRGLKLSTFNLEEAQKALSGILPDLLLKRDLGEYKQRQTGEIETVSADDPHMYIQTSSRLWEENIAFLSYHFGQHYFPLDAAAARTWLKNFLTSDSRESRLAALRELQFKTLRSGKVVPLLAGPHFDLLRKPWKKTINQISSSGMLWEIESN